MNTPELPDFKKSFTSYKPGKMKSVWEIIDEREKKKKPVRLFQFWFPVIISLAAFVVAVKSLSLQKEQLHKPPKQQQSIKQQPVPQDSTKN